MRAGGSPTRRSSSGSAEAHLTLLAVSTIEWILRGIAAVAAVVVIYLFLAAVLRKFKVAPDNEPDPSAVVPVNVRYRCIVCGAEVVMTAAQGDQPLDAPRHCREDMVEV